MKKFIMGVVALMLIVISGCSQTGVDKLSDNPYSRENVYYRSASAIFGSGRNEDIDVAVKYLYDSNEVSSVLGDSFEITGDKIICHKSESRSFFVLGFYSGEAVYEFVFGDICYEIIVSKKHFGKWKVDKCEQKEYKKNW